MLDVTHIDATITLVVDKHGKTTSVFGAFLRTSQYKVNVRVAIGDKTLHTIQTPAIFFLVEGCFQHHTLKVRTSIWFG